MNLLRKIKINKLIPIEFSQIEKNTLEFIRISLITLSHMKASDYYDLKYQNDTYFVHKSSVVYLRLNKNKDILYVDKNFLYQLSIDEEIKKKDLIDLVKYFYKKELSKQEPYCGALALNYLDKILKENHIIEIPL